MLFDLIGGAFFMILGIFLRLSAVGFDGNVLGG